MTCAACDSKSDGTYLAGKWHSYQIATSDTPSNFLNHCSGWLSTFGLYREMLSELLKYTETIKKTNETSKAIEDLKKITPAEQDWVKDCQIHDAKDAHCAVDGSYLTATAAGKLPEAKINAWDWWFDAKNNFNRTCEANLKVSDKCLASPGITMMINNFIFVNKTPSFNYFDVHYKALDAAFKALGNSKGQGILTSFYGKNVLKGKVGAAAPSKFKLELSSNGVNLDQASPEGKLRFEYEDLSVQYFENGFDQKCPESSVKGYKAPKPAAKKPAAKPSDAKSTDKKGAQPGKPAAKGDTGAKDAKKDKYAGLMKVISTLTLSL